MSDSKAVETKVGFFVLFCLIILAVLLIQFSKGASVLDSGYEIILNTANVGGLRAQSTVLMSGVKVGTVTKAVLSEQGTNVAIHLLIQKGQIIRDDAVFKIEQSGFLGDQYVAVYPVKSLGTILKPGSEIHAEEPFNFQEVAASAGTLIKRMDETLKKLNDAVDDIRHTALSEKTLTNFSESVNNLNRVTASALNTVERINLLVRTNEAPASLAVSNLVLFSSQLNTIGSRAQGILDGNSQQIGSTISNLQTSSVMITNLLADIQSGKGLAGALIENRAMAQDISLITSNLAVTTGNLNRYGAWRWLFYKPKSADTNVTTGAATGARLK